MLHRNVLKFAARVNCHCRSFSKLQTGIVGLPNIGKSTLFNALVGGSVAEAENYPFCTIEPNVGIVSVPDKRLDVLGGIHKSAKVVPVVMEFVDIAGIVKGASEGEGLGNKFLANIRQTDAIIHVVRCFVNDDVIHVDGHIDPLRDMDIINIELALADLAQVDKRLEKLKKERKMVVPLEKETLQKLSQVLADGKPARSVDLSKEELETVKAMMLLTMKPVIYAANVSDDALSKGGNEYSNKVFERAEEEKGHAVLVSAQVESELAGLEQEDKEMFLEELGVSEDTCGLKPLIKKAYKVLGLQTYFTAGPTETRAWTIHEGYRAPEAAGVIHSDFERGFIRAEVIHYADMLSSGSEKAVKENGLMISAGKDYVMQEGDIALFRFNV